MGWRKCCTVDPLALSSMALAERAMAGGPSCRLKVRHLLNSLQRQSWLAMYGRENATRTRLNRDVGSNLSKRRCLVLISRHGPTSHGSRRRLGRDMGDSALVPTPKEVRPTYRQT